MISLKKHYSEKVIPELKEALNLSTHMAVPKITKVTINMGVGEVLTDKKNLENVSKNGYNFIKNRFSWEKIGRLTKIAYQSL